jgi:hypothetical protein
MHILMPPTLALLLGRALGLTLLLALARKLENLVIEVKALRV